jgi:hypothetical protein
VGYLKKEEKDARELAPHPLKLHEMNAAPFFFLRGVARGFLKKPFAFSSLIRGCKRAKEKSPLAFPLKKRAFVLWYRYYFNRRPRTGFRAGVDPTTRVSNRATTRVLGKPQDARLTGLRPPLKLVESNDVGRRVRDSLPRLEHQPRVLYPARQSFSIHDRMLRETPSNAALF